MKRSGHHILLLAVLTMSLTGFTGISALNPLRAQFKFNHFTAIKVTDGAALQWNAISDTNTDHYTIQRAGEDSSFKNIGLVVALHTGQTNNSYQFIDHEMQQGINTYRLERVDRKGNKTLSAPASLANAELIIRSLSVYPNPASVSVTLECVEWANTQVDFNMTDSKGRQISQKTITLDSQGKWIIDHLPQPGYYLVKLTKDNVLYKQLLRVQQ